VLKRFGAVQRGFGWRRIAHALWKRFQILFGHNSARKRSRYHFAARLVPKYCGDRAQKATTTRERSRSTMMDRLKGKTALVTAAGQGIGRASALAMAAEGAKVIATDINIKQLESLASTPNIQTMRLDVLNDAEIKNVVAGLPKVNVLFNCAGFVHQGTIMETSDDDWDFSFKLNVRSMFKMIQAVLPGMVANGGGSIINMSSVVSSVKGLPNRFVYGATKAAVIGITKSIAADYVKGGIRCNAICPGTVETPSLLDRMAALGDVNEARKMFIARQPMGRLATPQEIAPLVVFLASDEAAFATGNAYSIDGGITI
jgi:2-keto-3-deoxy-L-fuconate dehydrogenase